MAPGTWYMKSSCRRFQKVAAGGVVFDIEAAAQHLVEVGQTEQVGADHHRIHRHHPPHHNNNFC